MLCLQSIKGSFVCIQRGRGGRGAGLDPASARQHCGQPAGAAGAHAPGAGHGPLHCPGGCPGHSGRLSSCACVLLSVTDTG